MNENPPNSPTTAPSLHSYLPNRNGMIESYQQRSILEPGKIIDIPILHLRDVVLFPGATLPLRIRGQERREMIQRIFSNPGDNPHIGIINLHYSVRGLTKVAANIGTTIEIREMTVNRDFASDTSNADEEIVLTAQGRYRFSILKWVFL